MSSGFHPQNEHVQSQNPNPNGDVPVPVTSLGTSSFPHSSSTTIDKHLPLALPRRIQVYPQATAHISNMLESQGFLSFFLDSRMHRWRDIY